ncbi:MAG TPA: sulfur transferase domain-containing protein, partial [Hyphomicrobiales bacterium]|nr:sulfur transferase domain-containing protein [Hyphomicrobiales bacterium]
EPPGYRARRNQMRPRGLRWRLRPYADRVVEALRRRRGAMDTPWRGFLGWVEHVFVDHAFFRYVYLNRHVVAPGIERAAQPSPRHIRAAARRGVKTIVNLRGERPCASYLMEQRACAQHGIALVDFMMTSRAPPQPDDVAAFDRLMATAERPVLLHCKSGADRAGLASALHLILHEGRPVEEALGQLSWRYGHVPHARTGVLDAFLLAYKAANDARPVDFRTWVREAYDPTAVKAAFHSRRGADLLAGRLLARE